MDPADLEPLVKVRKRIVYSCEECRRRKLKVGDFIISATRYTNPR